ncbi:MAG TPA: hypothetical protein VGA69_01265, partial [Nitriliruptorales bacterium]
MRSRPIERLLVALDDARRDGSPALDGLAAACAELTSMSGGAITVKTDGLPASGLGASSPWVAELEESQFTTGEGPGADAIARSQPVFLEDIGSRS